MATVLSRRATVAAIVLSLMPAPLLADEASKKAAIELYQQSSEKYRAGEFKEAADLLRKAYAIEPDPVLLYNLGRACEGMADDACAVDAYERYLALASPADRGAIEKKIATMKARLAATRNEPPKDPSPPPHSPSPWPWVVTGLGAATLGTGVVLGFVARSKHDDAVDEPVQTSAARAQDSAESMMRASNVLLVVGGVVTVTGLGWLIFDRASGTPTATSAALRAAPGSIWLDVKF
jgi:tetratricopeptide (TPR) repeat protein